MCPVGKFQALDGFFQDIDYIDSKTIDGAVDLRGFVSGMLSCFPWWLIVLYRFRAILARILGLVRHERPGLLSPLKPEALSFTAGEKASFFIVQKAKENSYWVAAAPEDKHLTACFGVAVEPLDSGLNRFYVFTTVKYRHWTGPVYFNLIRPFHHLVVWRMMRAGVAA